MTVFAEKIYALLKKVPKGKVTTYKDLANAAGSGAYRAVGQVLRCNPNAPIIPCHRVVASDGSIGGFFGETEGEPVARKMAMLKKEGIKFQGSQIVDFEKYRHKF
jgi:methylated-DNA-[protein]-cysteine S-methyltransferase